MRTAFMAYLTGSVEAVDFYAKHLTRFQETVSRLPMMTTSTHMRK
jgi:hypothetical protein